MSENDQRVTDRSGFVVVRLPDSRENDTFTDLVELAEKRKLPELAEVLRENGIGSAGRLITVLTTRELRKLDQAGKDSPFHRAESLTQYWRLDLREQVEVIPGLVAKLEALPYVEGAYAEPRMAVPDLKEARGAAKPRGARMRAHAAAAVYPQGHLDKAPTGIDAVYAWTQPGGDGSEIGLVDVELGWALDHVELAHLSIQRVFGDEKPGSAGHGAAVLGVVVAEHDGKGVNGVVQTPRLVAVASHYDALTNTELHVANAVLAAWSATRYGDVLLIEVENGGKPVEVDPAAAKAISDASERVVVLAAGNGGYNLDTLPDAEGAVPFSPQAAASDTGSIFVGAARSAVVQGGHERHSDSNHGCRVDCYAWGTLVATSGWDDDSPPPASVLPQVRYYTEFAGTSAASAIVAGAAVLIQSMNLAVNGTVLKPEELRDLLRDSALGTPQVNGEPGETIGSMPNLRAIADRIANSPPGPQSAPAL